MPPRIASIAVGRAICNLRAAVHARFQPRVRSFQDPAAPTLLQKVELGLKMRSTCRLPAPESTPFVGDSHFANDGSTVVRESTRKPSKDQRVTGSAEELCVTVVGMLVFNRRQERGSAGQGRQDTPASGKRCKRSRLSRH